MKPSPDETFLLFMLAAVYYHSTTHHERALTDLRKQVEHLQAQGVTEFPEYVYEILPDLLQTLDK